MGGGLGGEAGDHLVTRAPDGVREALGKVPLDRHRGKSSGCQGPRQVHGKETILTPASASAVDVLDTCCSFAITDVYTSV